LNWENPAASNGYEVQAPEQCVVEELVMSSKQDRIAWLVRRYNWLDPMPRRLHSIIPIFKPSFRRESEVVIMDLDGLHPKSLGKRLDDTGTSAFDLRQLRWLPNSRQLSFVSDGSLQVVDAD